MTTGEAAVAALIAHGLDTVYALPGVHNDPFFDALFKAAGQIRTIHTRHEQGAGYMALGAALATGKPQAYAVVPGPGLLNSGAALLTAYGMNAPVLAIVGQIPQAAIGRNLRLASLRAWSISPPASPGPPTRRVFSAMRSAPWRPAGPVRPHSNARWTCGAAAKRSRRSNARRLRRRRRSTRMRCSPRRSFSAARKIR
jgi:hypothetical protein